MRCADLVGVIIVTLDPLEDSQTVGADRTNMMDILQSVDAQRNQTATTVKPSWEKIDQIVNEYNQKSAKNKIMKSVLFLLKLTF